MKFRFFLSLFLFLLTALLGFGQSTRSQGQLTGQVLDGATRQPVPFASVTVWNKLGQDSTLAGGTQTDEQGHFSVSNLPNGRGWLSVSFVGYQAVRQAITLTDNKLAVNLGMLMLKTDATLLNEVKVTGEKADLTMSTEKRVFNVAKNLTTVGGIAEALLRNVPSIVIDESGNASLRNMATTIYINGKPTQLTLAQIPANQIESVEVITNPSARYDASTSGGIVNLVLKRNRQPGYTGMVSVGVGNNQRYDATANLDWREGRWNITALYSLNATQNPLTGYVNRINRNTQTGVPTSFFDQNTAINLNNTFQNGRVAVDYTANVRNQFSVAGTVVGGVYNTFSDQQYTYRDATRNRTGYGSRTLDPHNAYTNVGAEFDWKHTFARKGQELNVVTSVTRDRVSNTANWLTTSLDAVGNTQPGYPERDRIDGHIIGNQYLAQIDYVRPISDSAKWELGGRSFTFIRNMQYFFNQLDEPSKPICC